MSGMLSALAFLTTVSMRRIDRGLPEIIDVPAESRTRGHQRAQNWSVRPKALPYKSLRRCARNLAGTKPTLLDKESTLPMSIFAPDCQGTNAETNGSRGFPRIHLILT